MLRYWAGTIPITYIYAFIYYSSVITKYKKVYICQGCERLHVEKVIRHHTHSLLIYTDGTGYKGGGVSTFGLGMGRMIWNSGHLIRNLQFHIRALLQIVSQLGSYLFWKLTDTGMSPVSLEGLWPWSWARSVRVCCPGNLEVSKLNVWAVPVDHGKEHSRSCRRWALRWTQAGDWASPDWDRGPLVDQERDYL